MEALLAQVTGYAMNYAVRSGVALTANYAFKQCTRFIHVVGPGREREEIMSLQARLESKIRIISPAINMIELIAARGNTSLDSAVALTKTLRHDIQALGLRLAKAADEESVLSSVKGKSTEAEIELKGIIADIKLLLVQIEDAVPLINLAITTSGVNMSTSLPATVSPSRLLQASTFLSAGDSTYNVGHGRRVQIGPSFTLSLYMLFAGHSSRQKIKGAREMTWKEVIHKAKVKLMRVPLDEISKLPDAPARAQSNDDFFSFTVPADHASQEYAYQLLIIEDLDDDRFHTFDGDEPKPEKFEDVLNAGIREVIPIHEVAKIFYADTGKILNIGSDSDVNNPVLLLKRDSSAEPPRRMTSFQTGAEETMTPPGSPPGQSNGNDTGSDSEDDSHLQLHQESSTHLPKRSIVTAPTSSHGFPAGLDPEWMAFEVYVEEPDTDEEESEVESGLPEQFLPTTPKPTRGSSGEPMASAFTNLNLRGSTPSTPSGAKSSQLSTTAQASDSLYASTAQNSTRSIPAVRTSLSLLELLIRLTALQQFQQCTHLSIEDELLTFFLAESSSTGAGADSERRKMLRSSARRRVGFDPYAESPMKFRGEDYLNEHEQYQSPEDDSYGSASPGRFHSSQSIEELSSSRVNDPSSRRGAGIRSSPLPTNGRPWRATTPKTPGQQIGGAYRQEQEIKSSPLSRNENKRNTQN